jgi:hypothetical protein
LRVELGEGPLGVRLLDHLDSGHEIINDPAEKKCRALFGQTSVDWQLRANSGAGIQL